jgi:uncharacterized protein (TIGR04255 family)
LRFNVGNCIFQSMKIPTKISPDNLKDTIVQIIFNPACPPELVLGKFENSFIDQFEFKGGKPSKREIKIGEGNKINIDEFQGGYFLDKSGNIKISVGPNNLIFNKTDIYIGWIKYLNVISDTLFGSFENGIIDEITRIGVRYISQFDNIDIFSNLNMTLNIEIPNKNLDMTQFRSEFNYENSKVILTLLNRFVTKSIETDKNKIFSIIDIDVIRLFDSLKSSFEAISIIEENHKIQKETFFKLLKSDFLKSLNPIYT